MRRWIVVAVVVAAVVAVVAGIAYMRQGIVSAEEARERVARGDYDAVIDVRTAPEWSTGHHPMAIHLPLRELERELPRYVPDRGARILMVCKKGIRSAEAARRARAMGYRSVDSVSGVHHGLRGT
jgi:rhodanese-related sulfurtransferase